MLVLANKRKALPRSCQFSDPGSGLVFPNAAYPLIYSFEALLDRVKEHRLAYGGDLDIGWRERLEHDFCSQNPQISSTHHVPKKDLSIGAADLKRFGYSVLKHIQNGGDSVSQEEANRRAAICMQCPYRVETGICTACNGLVQYFEGKVFGEKTTPYDEKLGSCGVCKCYNKIAVHWPLSSQSTEGLTKEDFPEHCWKR